MATVRTATPFLLLFIVILMGIFVLPEHHRLPQKTTVESEGWVDGGCARVARQAAALAWRDGGSRSQSGEDLFAILGPLGGLSGGFFVEAGALDGLRFSNSELLTREGCGWRGLLVEANPALVPLATKNRPESTVVGAALCSSPRTVQWLQSGRPEVRGIFEFMSPAFLARWHRDPAARVLIDLPCVTLDSLLERHNRTHIDFLSLDVEGGEWEVLQGLSLSRVTIGVAAIEADGSNVTKDAAVRQHMVQAGYIYRGNQLRSDWFVHAGWKLP